MENPVVEPLFSTTALILTLAALLAGLALAWGIGA